MPHEIWPPGAPGMPVPGRDFLAAAQALGGTCVVGAKGKSRKQERLGEYTPELESIIRKSLYGGGQFVLNMTVSDRQKTPLMVLSGHRWGANPEGASPGPEPCEVMVLGKMLGDVEINKARCQIGKTGQHLMQTLLKLGIPKISRWYVSNVLKTENPDPNSSSSSLKQPWVNQFLHLLHQELRLVRPKYILCTGADALKALLGKNMSLDKMRGRVVEYEFPVHKSDDEPPEMHKVQVMACEHPAAVVRNPDKQARFELDLARFGKLVSGDRWDRLERGIDHRIVDNEKDLRDIIAEAEANNPLRIVALDAEWHGQHPQNIGSYMRCFQFSWAHKKAVCVTLAEVGGEPAFKRFVRDREGRPIKVKGGYLTTTKGGKERAFAMLGKYLQKKRVVGHFLLSDMEWFLAAGLDLREQFAAPENWQDCREQGGWDTGLMGHALDETGLFSLTDQTLRYTKAPRYDVQLDEWKVNFCRRNDLKPSQLEGYGECPGEVLYPYGAYDADVTRRLALRHAKALDCDQYGNNCWEAFWISQRAAMAAFEINTTGIPVDRNRLDKLTQVYMSSRNRLRMEIRQWAGWDINLEAADQVRELLFGEEANRKYDHQGKPKRTRPDGAYCLRVMPATTTEKRPREWERVLEEGSEKNFTPSTNKMALGILLQEWKKTKVWDPRLKSWVLKSEADRKRLRDQIQQIRDYRFISQVLKSTLRKPRDTAEESESDDPFEVDENGNFLYDAGLPAAICDDGRVRTFISQVKETGRWASSRPPLMNLSKRREPDYKRILGSQYEHQLRSIFCADPGHVLLEADYVGAELFGMAIMSGDELMIEHALRNQLDEDHPNYYDIHSNIAVLAFGFQCAPTKAGLESIGKAFMRIVAKSVVFGVAYGRGAKAIALAAREEGVTITVEDAQKVIDAIFRMYPKLEPFFAECRQRAILRDERGNVVPGAPGWLCGPFGRYRRFPFTTERDVAGEYERQAMNFPIQGMIADAMSRATDQLLQYRREVGMKFKIVLQIHDALLFMVPFQEVPFFVENVLPTCMSKRVPIHPCHLDGIPNGTGPYFLGTDNEICDHWGDHMLPSDCWERKISEKYAGWKANPQFAGGWAGKHFSGNVWLEKTQRLHPIVADKTAKQIFKEDGIRLAVKLGKLPAPEDMAKALKQISNKDLLKLITNEQGNFVAA